MYLGGKLEQLGFRMWKSRTIFQQKKGAEEKKRHSKIAIHQIPRLPTTINLIGFTESTKDSTVQHQVNHFLNGLGSLGRSYPDLGVGRSRKRGHQWSERARFLDGDGSRGVTTGDGSAGLAPREVQIQQHTNKA